MWLRGRGNAPKSGDVIDIAAPPWAKRWEPAVLTTAMVGVAAFLAYAGERWLDPQSLALFFVVPIVLAAIGYGMRASLAASLLSVAAINFLFVEPRYTLAVARAQDVAALMLLATVGIVVSVIAESARAAQAARSEAARERFKAELLAGVSHDLRTPLSTIVFTLQSLQRFADHEPVERAELLKLAESEARRLAELVDVLLTSSRVEAGASPVHLEPASVGEIVGSALRSANIDAERVALSIPEGLPLVCADPALAARALANVVANAAKYAAPSLVTIEARCEAHSVVLDICDRGPGLGANPERLFQKFVRGASGDGRAPGLGLGLSLARDFMELQGGALTAANREGGGARFTLGLPCWTKAVRDGQ